MPFKEKYVVAFVVMLWSLLIFGNANGNTLHPHRKLVDSVNQPSENVRLSKRQAKRSHRKLKSKKNQKGSFKKTLEAVLKVFVIPYSIAFGLVGLFALLFGKSLTIWQILLWSLGIYASFVFILGAIFFIGYHTSGRKPRPVAS